jgi:hypothetical protein
MPLPTEQALRFARRLMTVPDFPRSDEAVLATSEDLQDLVTDLPEDIAVKQIEWLTQHIRHSWQSWTENGGTAIMLALYHREFDPPARASNEVQDWGTRPPVDCVFCEDAGIVRPVYAEAEAAAWCICEHAIWLKQTWPEYLQLIRSGNKPSAKILPIRRNVVLSEPISPEFEQAVRTAIPQHVERCPKCNGTGIVISGGYCDCDLGKDLERVEKRG